MTNRLELAVAEEVRRLDAFQAELNVLLERHGAMLGVTVEGDTHGIDDSYIDVCFSPLSNGVRTIDTDQVRLFQES